MKNDSYCDPYTDMSAKNVKDAKRECSNDVRCHMFFDQVGFYFRSCSDTALIKKSTIGSILYQQKGSRKYTEFQHFTQIL